MTAAPGTPAESLARWRAAGRSFRHRGLDVFYRDDGVGDALLCIHGFPTASWDWERLWPRLRARFRVIAPDMLGFGFSAKPRDFAYSIDAQATLHEALLATLGIERCHVLAHDYGDSVAQELLARFEERRRAGTPGLELRSVVFLNGGLFPEAHRPLRGQRLLASPLGPLFARLASARSFRASFRRIFGPRTQPSDAELAAFWTLFSGGGGTRIAAKLIGYMAERRRRRERWVGALRETSVPLRVIDGALDPVSGRHMTERYRELVPDPDVVLLEEIGHYPQVEDPEGVWRAFAEFHDRLGAGAALPRSGAPV